ncbi:LOW QUALITY PROTEIN: papilin-like [Oncorhynchus kisutch]|uniref:LOW QUALITY PROTEIN: papilin-like n=1 Tax=Oncorhynchus kisutch TaxID=8019 RepID=UPI0012DDA32A|nr:LOW QUALITY PROTEIN: papilin-like [Oncorhynchus kisutch]
MLWCLVAVQLFLVPALLLPSGDHWEEWSPYGECSRSCGSGVTMRTRRCVTQRTDGGNNCVGPDKSYRSCNIQDCPGGSRDFREEQCSQFDGSDFQGKRYKWLPYYGADNPCELNCIPRGENFFYRHQTAVVDGTPCHPGRKDVCVDGVCKRLGCDNMLESPQQEDPCLQCGGNGQSCYPVRSTFNINNLPKGYNQLFIIPVGATSIRIGETVATRNYLAVKNLRGEYYLNGHWVIEFSRATPVAGTMLYYQRGAEGEMTPETIIGRGPTTEPLVIELISQEHNQGVEYEYYLPNGHSREGHYWSFGSWAACSRECGSGYQSRLVFCAIDNEAYPDYLCSALPRPLTNRTCNTQQCPQTQSWSTGEWNVCSVSCGGGSQVRSVQCVSHDASGPRVVEDAVCAAYALTPPTLQTCNMQRCVSWRASVWSACSVTCGTGDQSREVMCVGAASVQLADTSCIASLRPVAAQPCSMPACLLSVSWHVGDWGLCSKRCESGLRERQVMCSDRERNLYPVERCNSVPKPLTVETCNTQPCYSPQVVPSMQDPRGQDHTQHGVPDHATVLRPDSADHQTNTVYHGHSSGPAQHCSRSYYGCCPDGVMAAGGTGGLGCPRGSSPEQAVCTTNRKYSPAPTTPLLPAENSIQCRLTTYGCCFDRTSAAAGPDGEGCPTPPDNVPRTTCSLPKAAGSCSGWTGRYFYDVTAAKCSHFWYGGCHGNDNNFLTRGDCQSRCPGARASQTSHTYQPSQSGHDMRRLHGAARHLRGIHWRAQGSQRRRPRPQGQGPCPAPPPSHLLRSANPPCSEPDTARGVKIDQSDPTTVEALVGQTVVLPCRVSPAPSSTIIVEWRKDGVPLTTFRHHPQPNGSLLVGPLTKADSGWLLCVATRDRERDHRYVYLSVSENTRGSQAVQDTTGSLPQDGADRTGETGVNLPSVPHRQPSPKFSIDRSGSSSVEGKAGQTVRLACKIIPTSALSSVSLQWTREGQTLNSLRHAQHADGTLVIGQLRSDDSGVYTCTGSTHSQLEQRQLTLKVQGDLRITMPPNNVQVSQGGTAQLPCVVSGDNVSVGWSRNGVPVRPDGGRVQMSSDGSLILNNVQPADEGSYTCNAYTGTYSVSATAEVRINKASRQGVDQPELANCELIVYARLCNSQYYSSFCCASCARHAKGEDRYGQIG